MKTLRKIEGIQKLCAVKLGNGFDGHKDRLDYEKVDADSGQLISWSVEASLEIPVHVFGKKQWQYVTLCQDIAKLAKHIKHIEVFVDTSTNRAVTDLGLQTTAFDLEMVDGSRIHLTQVYEVAEQRLLNYCPVYLV